MKNSLLIVPILFIFEFVSANKYEAQSLFESLNGKNLKGNEIIAEAGPVNITSEEFFYSYEFGPAFAKREKDSKEIHLKYMINEKLLALDAYKNKLFNDEADDMFDDIKADLATEEMFRDEILAKVKISQNEIDTIINAKLIELEIKWLYTEDQNGMVEYVNVIKNGMPFDSLFDTQINDSIYTDMRMMNVTSYDLLKKNPMLYSIVDTLKAGSISAPIHTKDGWYMVKLNNVTKSLITGETEFNKLKYEAEEAVTKFKMDALSDRYVDSLMKSKDLTIKRDPFNLVRSYLAKYILPGEKYNEWELENKLETALSNLGLSKNDTYPGLELVTGTNQSFSVDEFLIWFRNRNLYLKFNKDNITAFSISLENMVWRMVRDKLLTTVADAKGYFENEWVKTQSKWWKDKIAYGVLRNKLSESILLENKELNLNGDTNKTDMEKLSEELSTKILRKVIKLRNETKVKINSDVLGKLNVSQENDKKTIELYNVKKGGLIPRPAYPTIDNDWASWE